MYLFRNAHTQHRGRGGVQHLLYSSSSVHSSSTTTTTFSSFSSTRYNALRGLTAALQGCCVCSPGISLHWAYGFYYRIQINTSCSTCCSSSSSPLPFPLPTLLFLLLLLFFLLLPPPTNCFVSTPGAPRTHRCTLLSHTLPASHVSIHLLIPHPQHLMPRSSQTQLLKRLPNIQLPCLAILHLHQEVSGRPGTSCTPATMRIPAASNLRALQLAIANPITISTAACCSASRPPLPKKARACPPVGLELVGKAGWREQQAILAACAHKTRLGRRDAQGICACCCACRARREVRTIGRPASQIGDRHRLRRYRLRNQAAERAREMSS